jgi:hypothetical protein
MHPVARLISEDTGYTLFRLNLDLDVFSEQNWVKLWLISV